MKQHKSVEFGIIVGVALAITISSFLYPQITILNEGGISTGTEIVECRIFNPTINTWYFGDRVYIEYKDGNDWKALGESVPDELTVGEKYAIPLRTAELSFDISSYSELLVPGEYRLVVSMKQRDGVNPIARRYEFTVK